MKLLTITTIISCVLLISCKNKTSKQQQTLTDKKAEKMKREVTIMTLDPGHFHAALVQKSTYDRVNDTVYVYGADGTDITDHLHRIDGFNTRIENPTNWIEKVYKGDDYLKKMIAEKPGNVMVVSGKNNLKMGYIKAVVDAGINVFADKPMVISPEDYIVLEEVFKTAKQKNLLVYDIMTERFEITTILQRELSMIPEVFGKLMEGTTEKPAITKESVHHFFKFVSGKPLKRPEWFFDTKQRGEGLNDVTTHLVDLVQWEAFPNQILHKSDIEIVDARHWKTTLTLDQFRKVTGSDSFPQFLKKDIKDNKLQIYCNGSITYKIKGIYAKTSVTWNFQAPKGTGDTHYSIMRGTKCNLIIKQGVEENFKPKLYITIKSNEDKAEFEYKLKTAVESKIASNYPGLGLIRINDTSWAIDIPEKYKIGHEEHFGEVTKNYLKYLREGNIPEWEVPNMLVKYYTTSQASEMVNN